MKRESAWAYFGIGIVRALHMAHIYWFYEYLFGKNYDESVFGNA